MTRIKYILIVVTVQNQKFSKVHVRVDRQNVVAAHAVLSGAYTENNHQSFGVLPYESGSETTTRPRTTGNRLLCG